MTLSDQQETAISRNTKINLGLVATLIVSIVGGAIWLFTQRVNDIEADRQGREQILEELREFRSEFSDYQAQADKRVTSLEMKVSNNKKNRWTSGMQEIWVLRSREAGELVDPAPIIERHSE